MSDSIFRSLAVSRTPGAFSAPRAFADARSGAPAKRPAAARQSSASKDAAFIAIIAAPLEWDETAYVGFDRKEAELRTAFAALSVLEARALQSRLSNPRSGDQLAAAFMRLTGERRARLINFLADARRREALAGQR